MKKKEIRSMSGTHNRKENRVWPVVLAATIITVIALAVVFGEEVIKHFKADDTQDTLQEMYKGTKKTSLMDILLPSAYAEEEIDAAADEMPEAATEEPIIHEDFTELYNHNSHLVGWLCAGGRIDYPVVQYDNSFYLEHDYFGEEDRNGTLFINAANQLNPRDSILLIHGHNMKSGAMFGDLDFYRTYSFLQENPLVSFRTIYDQEDVYYVPIAAFDASMNPDAEGYFNIGKIRFDFDFFSEEDETWRSSELEEHISLMREMSFWDSPVDANSTDEYIILVTCSYSHDDGRMMLVCRKLREEETREGMLELFAEDK